MSDDLVDDLLAAAIASQSLDQSLTALGQVTTKADAAAASADAAAATLASIGAALNAVGVDHLWTGTQLQIRLRTGAYGTAVDLKGDTGEAGAVPVLHVGTVTDGPFSVGIHVTDPANPIIDFVLPRGWSPVIAGVTDGSREVFQLVDWIGGQGAKPAIGLYIGASGLVSDLASATNFRGLPGGIAQNGSVTPTHLARFNSTNLIEDAGATLSIFGQGLIAAASAAAVKALLSLAAADVSGAEAVANKGAANGYAGLDGAAKVPLAQLPASVIGALNYQGIWNASINSPPLASGIGTKGALYKVATAGTTPIDGITQWNVGDSIVFDGLVWDKIDGIANEVIRVAGLFGDINGAALKTALAIAVADVSGAVASARQIATGAGLSGGGDLSADRTLSIANNAVTNALLAQATSLTLKANLGGATANVSDVTLSSALDAFFSTTRGSVLFRGASAWSALAPGSAGQALLTQGSGADPTWGTSSFPIVGITPKSANYTILAADKGQMFDLTGSVALTLPAASTASAGNPFWIHIRKRDGTGAGSVLRAGSDTIDGGLTSLSVYQEQFTIFSFGSGWYLQNRQRGLIDIQPPLAFSAQSVLAFTFDTELRDVEIQLFNVTTSVASPTLYAQFFQSGAYVATGYRWQTAEFSGNSADTNRNSASDTQVPMGADLGTTAAIFDFTLRLENIQSTVAKSILARIASLTHDTSPGGGGGLVYAQMTGWGFSNTAAACAGAKIYPGSGTFSGLYSMRGVRL